MAHVPTHKTNDTKQTFKRVPRLFAAAAAVWVTLNRGSFSSPSAAGRVHQKANTAFQTINSRHGEIDDTNLRDCFF